MAAQRIIAGEGDVYVAGGVEIISCVQNEINKHMLAESWLHASTSRRSTGRCCRPPRQVAKRYKIARERRTSTACAASRRAAAAQAAGKFKDEIVPITVTAGVADKVLGLRTQGSDGRAPTRASAPGTTYEARGEDQAGDARRRDRGRQRQPVLRRRAAPAS